MNSDYDNGDDQDYLKALTVLYVEDEADIREELAQFLRRRVAKVHTAAHGQAGLDIFAQHQPDLVITDIRMPGMDGLDMAERIRAMNPKTPIILTTAFEETRYFQRAIDLGVDKYVTKPVKLDLLASVLRKCARTLRAEAALHEVHERYRLLFQISHIAISVADTSGDPNVLVLDGRILDCNQAFLKLLGYASHAELTAVPFGDLLTPESRDVVNQQVRDELWVRGISRECELEFRHQDGHRVPVIVQFILHHNAAGQAREIMALISDLSQQRRTEQALRLTRQVFECTSEGIIITDADNGILLTNPAFSRITGYSQAEAVGQNPRLLKSDRHDQAFYRQLWERLLANGHWQGELWNRRKTGEIYPEWLSISVVRDAQGQLANYIAIFSDMSERKAAEQHLDFLAHYDPLTHLANRSFLEHQAGQLLGLAARNKTRLALLFLDLDRFKIINDSLGRADSDMILETVANRLREAIREVDLLGRVGGDQFVIILPAIADPSNASTVARKLNAVVNEPMPIAGQLLTVTASIGISLYPEDGGDYETLLKQADTAMYGAKKAGRNHFMFFAQSMNGDAQRQLQLESALRLALKNQEFELHYQPQVDIASGRIIGMEALLRWHSATLGRIMPGHFIPLAEETGLIIPIGEWVLREACRQNAEWQRQGLPAVAVAVNLSALQFRQQNLLERVQSALQDSALAPNHLELELTESMLMQDIGQVMNSLHPLRKMGVKLAIDDFGTGYSSLAYLKRFAVNKLKIDQSFVKDIPGDGDDDKIVEAIISLAHVLNLTVIAEGVETLEQLNFLRDHHCDEIQGYWYSKPLPAADMAKRLGQEPAGIPRP